MIRLAVGCDPNNSDLESQAVLEASCRKHTNEPLEITWLKLSKASNSFWFSNGQSGWQTAQWVTSFSGLRWGLAAFFGFEGEYIYSDSDVIFCADIGELWRQPITPGRVAIAKGGGSWRYCVSKWSASSARKHFLPIEDLRSQPDSHSRMSAYFRMHPELTESFVGRDWNVLDGENYSLKDPRIGAIHYTSIDTQPHLRFAIPRLKAEGRSHWYDGPVRTHPRPEIVELFDREFEEAKAAGYTPDKYAAPSFGDYKKRSLKGYRSRSKAV